MEVLLLTLQLLHRVIVKELAFLSVNLGQVDLWLDRLYQPNVD